MYTSSWLRTTSAIIMILAIINMKAGNYYLQRAFLEPLQELSASFSPSLFTDDCGEHGFCDHKPPKSSYSKHDGLSGSTNLSHISSPAASRLCFYEQFKALPEVFAEIIVPPKIL